MYSTHSSGFHNVWASNKSNVFLPDSQYFVVEKDRLVSANHTSAVTSDPVSESSFNTLTFSHAELEANIVDAEQNPTAPNAGTMAQIIRSMF